MTLARAKLSCIACSVFKSQLDRLRDSGDFDLPVHYFPSELHTRERDLHKRLEIMLRESRARGGRTLLVAGDCHPFIKEQESLPGTCSVGGENCVEMLLGADNYRSLRRQRVLFLAPEWSAEWRDCLYDGLDSAEGGRRELRPGAYSKVVYLDTGSMPVPEATLSDMSRELGLPCEVMEVGPEPLLAAIRGAWQQAEMDLPNWRERSGNWKKSAQALAVDLLTAAVAKAGDLRELGRYIATELRQLTGARVVAVFQCVHVGVHESHMVVGVDPERRRAVVESRAGERLAGIIHSLSGPAELGGSGATDEASDLLQGFPKGRAVVAPLRVGGKDAGSIALLGLADDAPGVARAVQILDLLTSVLAPVFRNSFLYERQEQIIEARTEEICAANEALRTEIEQHKETSAALQSSRERLDVMFQYAPDGYFLCDGGGRIVDCNRAALAMTGRAKPELLESDIDEVFGPSLFQQFERLEGSHAAALSKAVIVAERSVLGAGASDLIAEIRAHPVLIGGDGYFLVSARDVTRRCRAEEELRVRVSQQAVVARLGQQALAGSDLQSVMNEAVKAVAGGLNLEYAKVLELLPGARELLLRAGVGWKPGLVGVATVGADTDSQAGFTLVSRGPVIVKDLLTEHRFSGPSLLLDHRVVSGLSVAIAGKNGPFGVLGAHTTESREFSKHDVNFLESIAAVLAESIALRDAENELSSLNEELEQRVADRTV